MNKKIPFNDLNRSFKLIKKRYLKKLLKIHKNSNYINGKEVSNFEKKIAKFLDVKYVISCGNGTDALMLSIFSLNLKKNDEVIIPAFSYISVIEVVLFLGLKPVLVDVNLETFNIDINELTKAINFKTKLIIPVHLFGNNCNMQEIIKIAKKNNIYIIEDAAQSISSKITINNRKLNSGTLGNIGCTSFFPTKNLGCFGDGGAVITNNKKIADKIKMLRNHGQEKKYFHKIIGFNSRLDTIQALVLSLKINYLKGENKIRKKIALKYDNELKNIKQISIPKKNEFSEHIYHQYSIRITNGKRNALKSFLEKKGISTIIYYPLPFQSQKAYKSKVKKIGQLRNSSIICKQILSLPVYPYLRTDELMYIIKSIKEFFNEKK